MEQIISTIPQKCKRCYSCIRECPANAIKVCDGQAFVIAERCIACGHCVKVCSQNAKYVRNDISFVRNLINESRVFAIVAPSFVATFNTHHKQFISALRTLGFERVFETAFGADLISSNYRTLFNNMNGENIISSPCPAVCSLITKYYPELVDNLANVDSPMTAMGKYIKHKYGEDVKVVFIGPCTAKKKEIEDPQVSPYIDAALTFKEIKEFIYDENIELNSLEASSFDEPVAYKGRSFPLVGGLLSATDISYDTKCKSVITVEGKLKTIELLNELRDDKINSKFIDVLFCEGCISGPAIATDDNYYTKRENVIDYFVEQNNKTDKTKWQAEIYNSRTINLIRKFNAVPVDEVDIPDSEIEEILRRTGKGEKEDRLNCGACGYRTCEEKAKAIARGIAEEEMCLPFLIDELKQMNRKLMETHEQLVHAEKLASIGQLSAGLAHELNNPLSSIIMYSKLMRSNSLVSNNSNLTNDIDTIYSEAKRCSEIVKKLLDFSREEKISPEYFSLGSLIGETVNQLCIDRKSMNISVNNRTGSDIIYADRNKLKQVLLNVIKNAIDATENINKPDVRIELGKIEDNLTLTIKDNGCGIKREDLKKIFTPFFTTKKMGKGVGLGLAISYGIIKLHNGKIRIDSKENEGTEVLIELPANMHLIKENNNETIQENIIG